MHLNNLEYHGKCIRNSIPKAKLMLYRLITHRVKAFISYNFDDYGLEKTPKFSISDNLNILIQKCQPTEKYIHVYMSSILGWASFCMNFCINAA